jgi:hypothetical protein
MRCAARVAINRIVAGVHTPVDTAAGTLLGVTLGNYLVARLRADNSFQPWSFDGTKFGATEDFDWTRLYDPALMQPPAVPPTWASTDGATYDPGTASGVLTYLWGKAAAEWP